MAAADSMRLILLEHARADNSESRFAKNSPHPSRAGNSNLNFHLDRTSHASSITNGERRATSVGRAFLPAAGLLPGDYNTGESLPSIFFRTILIGGVPCFRKLL